MNEKKLHDIVKKLEPTRSPTFTYEEALALQMEGCLDLMEQSNHELMTIFERVHTYLKYLGAKKGKEAQKGLEEDGPPRFQDDEEK